MIDTFLVIARYVPDPNRSSGELRFWQILHHLRSRADRLVLLTEVPGDPALVPGVDLGSTARLDDWAPRADLALLEFWYMDEFLPALRAHGVPVVIDSVDVEFIRREREKIALGIEGDYYHLEKAREIRAYESVDQVWAVSDRDADRIRSHARDLAVIPNILDTDRPPTPFADRDGVCFVGSYRHFPNVDALRWYRKAVRPRLRGVPHAIVGYDAPADIRAMRGFVGGAPCSADHVARARVSIAPLRYGAGLKGKVLEAMVCGTPVVTTSIGAEGYGDEASPPVHVADEPADFARTVRMLLEDRDAWQDASERGRAFARRYAPEVVGAEIDRALARVVPLETQAAS